MIKKSIVGQVPSFFRLWRGALNGLMFHWAVLFTIAALLLCCRTSLISAQETAPPQPQPQRKPVGMSVVVVNPSDTKPQTVPIKRYLPIEVTPEAVLDPAGLDIEFDEEKSIYYLYKEAVVLEPAETKTFGVKIRDVWFIPQERLDSLRNQAESVIGQLEESEFYDPAQRLGEAIYKALETIAVTQNDEAVSRKNHIILYRNNLKIVEQVKEDIGRLEKQLEFAVSQPESEGPDVPIQDKKDGDKDDAKEIPGKGIVESIVDALPDLFK